MSCIGNRKKNTAKRLPFLKALKRRMILYVKGASKELAGRESITKLVARACCCGTSHCSQDCATCAISRKSTETQSRPDWTAGL